MTLDELIETLTEIRDDNEGIGDREVNIGYQPNYPLAGLITNVTEIEEEDDEGNGDVSIWIAVSDNQREPYAPRAAWEHR